MEVICQPSTSTHGYRLKGQSHKVTAPACPGHWSLLHTMDAAAPAGSSLDTASVTRLSRVQQEQHGQGATSKKSVKSQKKTDPSVVSTICCVDYFLSLMHTQGREWTAFTSRQVGKTFAPRLFENYILKLCLCLDFVKAKIIIIKKIYTVLLKDLLIALYINII